MNGYESITSENQEAKMVVARVLVLGPVADEALELMKGKYGNDTHFIHATTYEPEGVRSASRFIRSAQLSHYEEVLQGLLKNGTRDGVAAVLIGSQPFRDGFGQWDHFVDDFWNWRPVYEVMLVDDVVDSLHCRNGREDDIRVVVNA